MQSSAVSRMAALRASLLRRACSSRERSIALASTLATACRKEISSAREPARLARRPRHSAPSAVRARG